MNRWVWFALGTMVVLAIGYQTYDMLRDYGEKELLKDAAAQLEAGQLENAVRFAYKVYQRNPTSDQATRIIAQCLEQINISIAVQWWEKTLRLKPNDFEAFSRVLALKLNASNSGEMEAFIDSASPEFRSNPDYHKLVAVAYLKMSKYELAHEAFSRALELKPQDTNSLLNKLLIESQSSSQDRARSAFEEILQLAQPGSPTEAHALFNLVRSDLNQRLTTSQMVEFTERYLQLQQPDFSKRVEVIVTAVKLCPDHRLRWLSQFEAQNINTSARLAYYGDALNRAGESQRVLFLVERIRSQRREYPRLNDTYLDALMMEEKWVEAQEWLNSIPEASRILWHDVVRRVLDVDRHWNQLNRNLIKLKLKQVEDPSQLSWILAKAELHGWGLIKEIVLWELSEFPGYQFTALNQLKEYYSKRHDGLGVLQASRKILEIEPDLLGAKATVAHLEMCRKVDSKTAYRLAETCYEQSPELPTLRMIYVLSLHLQGRDGEAFLILNGFTAAERELPGMTLYFEYFDWISGAKSEPPHLDVIPAGYLDLEIKLLKKLVKKIVATRHQ